MTMNLLYTKQRFGIMALLVVALLLALVPLVSAFEVSILPDPATDDDNLECYVDGERGSSLTDYYTFEWRAAGSSTVLSRTPFLSNTRTTPGHTVICYVYDLDTRILLDQDSITIQDETVPTNTPPRIQLIGPVDGTTITDDAINFEFGVIDEDETVSCDVTVEAEDGGATLASGTVLADGLAVAILYPDYLNNGEYTWSITCTDSEGESATSAEWTFTLDNPIIHLVIPEDGSVVNPNPRFTFSVENNDEGSLSCSVFVDDLSDTGSSWMIMATILVPDGEEGEYQSDRTALGEGEYRWLVVCEDDEEHEFQSIEVWSFEISEEAEVPLEITLVAPTDGAVLLESTATFTFMLEGQTEDLRCWIRTTGDGDASDTDGTMNIPFRDSVFDGLIDGIADLFGHGREPTDGEYSFRISGLVEGDHTWRVICSPVAGIGRVTSEEWTYRVILNLPDVELVSPANGSTVPGEVIFSYTVEDPDDTTVRCGLYVGETDAVAMDVVAVEDVLADGTIQTVSYGGFVDGEEYRWAVRCYDSRGAGYGDTAGPWTFTVDTSIPVDMIVPEVTLELPTDGTVISSEDITLSYSVVDSSDATVSCSLVYTSLSTASTTPLVTVPADGSTLFTTLYDLDNGPYSWYVECTDTAGNVGVSETRLFTINVTGVVDEVPVVTLFEPSPGDVVATSTVPFEFTVTDDVDSTVSCDLLVRPMGGSYVDYGRTTVPADGSTQTVTATLADGAYEWTLYCPDSRGVIYAELPPEVAFRVDTSGVVDNPPTITLDIPADGATITASPITFTYSVTDDYDSTLSCQLFTNLHSGGSAVADSSVAVVPADGSPQTFTGTASVDGAFEWTVFCFDSRGDATGVFAGIRTFTVDTTLVNLPPTIILGLPVDGSTLLSGSPADLFYTVTDDHDADVSCQLRFGTDPSMSGTVGTPVMVSADGVSHSFTLSGLADGTYYWSVTCRDSSGDTSSPAPHRFSLATTVVDLPPVVELLSPDDGAVLSTLDVPLTFVLNDEDPSFSCELWLDSTTPGILDAVAVLSGTATVAGSRTLSFTPSELIASGLIGELESRRYHWNVRCTDPAGQVSIDDTTRAFVFIPDVTGEGPSVTIHAVPSAGSAPLSVNFFADVVGEAPFTYEWSFGDGSPRSKLAGPLHHTFTKDGTYIVYLTVKDNTGASTRAQATVTVTTPGALVDPARDLRIERIRLVGSPGLDEAVIGEEVLMAITIKDDAPRDFEDLHVALLIEGAGVRRMIGPFDIEQHDEVTKFVLLDIPEYADPGEYAVRVSVSNDDIRRVKHRDVWLIE